MWGEVLRHAAVLHGVDVTHRLLGLGQQGRVAPHTHWLLAVHEQGRRDALGLGGGGGRVGLHLSRGGAVIAEHRGAGHGPLGDTHARVTGAVTVVHPGGRGGRVLLLVVMVLMGEGGRRPVMVTRVRQARAAHHGRDADGGRRRDSVRASGARAAGGGDGHGAAARHARHLSAGAEAPRRGAARVQLGAVAGPRGAGRGGGDGRRRGAGHAHSQGGTQHSPS